MKHLNFFVKYRFVHKCFRTSFVLNRVHETTDGDVEPFYYFISKYTKFCQILYVVNIQNKKNALSKQLNPRLTIP
jgi:hypothetical protein